MKRLVAGCALLLLGSVATAQAQPYGWQDGPPPPPPPPHGWGPPPPPPPGWDWRHSGYDGRVGYRRCWWEDDDYGRHRVCRRGW